MFSTGMPVLSLSCINKGGSQSLIRLPVSPRLEVEKVFYGSLLRSLACWQARPGDIVTVCDPQGKFFRARLTRLTPSEARLVVFSPLSFPPESFLRIDLFQALPQRERFELILEKATEIGVSRIIPFSCRRSITVTERDARQRKSHRWPEVVLRAAKQCRRGTIPELLPVLPWQEALAEAGAAKAVFVFSEREESRRLRDAAAAVSSVRHAALWIGPEGGFTEEEITEMELAGFVAVSLGGRILRTETAAVAGMVMIQHMLGDLG